MNDTAISEPQRRALWSLLCKAVRDGAYDRVRSLGGGYPHTGTLRALVRKGLAVVIVNRWCEEYGLSLNGLKELSGQNTTDLQWTSLAHMHEQYGDERPAVPDALLKGLQSCFRDVQVRRVEDARETAAVFCRLLHNSPPSEET